MKIRKSICQGLWYPKEKRLLKTTVEKLMEQSIDFNLNIKAVIVPHAGITYSGEIAALGIKQLKNEKRVVILGTSHYFPLKGISKVNVDFYETPLGKVRVEKSDKFKYVKEAHTKEHSIEIELPFLQSVLKDFTILPLLVGSVDSNEFSTFLEKEKCPILVSVDLSHFHRYEHAVELDKKTIQAILNLDLAKIQKCEIDSPFAVASLISLAKRKGWKTKLLKYKNSGDITKDKDSVVGYCAIAFYSEENNDYSKQENQFILNLVKSTVENYVKGKDVKVDNFPQKFKSKRGCFVTLYKNRKLRGCIGTLIPFENLGKDIVSNAIAASSKDPRFPPVKPSELEEINYEVSILTQPKEIEFKEEEDLFKKIKGKGVILSKGFAMATYLPQVWEQFTDEKSFLTSLCIKAGLSRNEWKEKITIKTYEAIVIKE